LVRAHPVSRGNEQNGRIRSPIKRERFVRRANLSDVAGSLERGRKKGLMAYSSTGKRRDNYLMGS